MGSVHAGGGKVSVRSAGRGVVGLKGVVLITRPTAERSGTGYDTQYLCWRNRRELIIAGSLRSRVALKWRRLSESCDRQKLNESAEQSIQTIQKCDKTDKTY